MWSEKFVSKWFVESDIEKCLANDEENLHPLLTAAANAAGVTPINGNGTFRNGRASSSGASTRNSGIISVPPPIVPSLPTPVQQARALKLALPGDPIASAASTPDSTPSPPTASAEPLPRRFRRSDRRQRRLNTELLEAIQNKEFEEFERLLNTGANPNATCRLDLVSACHMAALHAGDYLLLLIKKGAETHRQDRLGRTPLHLAAWAGNARQVAVLLDFPEDMYDRVEVDTMSSETEDDVRKLSEKTRQLANVSCSIQEVKMLLPKEWKDNIDHNCVDITGRIPLIQPGWTPLHVAAACARSHGTRLLLAAGADPNAKDLLGRTPLDVVGSAHYYDTEINSLNFTEVIKKLIKVGGKHNTMKDKCLNMMSTPLHTAVELEALEAIKEFLDHDVLVACHNEDGLTALHVCVKKELEEPLQLLANATNDGDPFAATIDVKDSEGYTVLQTAVQAAWVPGVCVALEAGADVTLKAHDGETAIHTAAALGNVDVLTEILSVAKQKDSIDCQNTYGETPLFKAVTNGHVDCVKAILKEGASIKICLPGEFNVFHRAAEYGHLEIIKILMEHDEIDSNVMINAKTDSDKKGFAPIHFAVYNKHPECVKYLLFKGADVRARTSCSPHRESTPLHLAVLKNYVDIVNIILNFDSTTIHEVNSMGWFPLHMASHHVSRDVIPLLLQAGADLSGYTDGPKRFRKTAIDMLVNNLSKPTEYLEDLFDSYISASSHNLQDADSVVTLDYSVLMPRSCEMEQMKVIEALLKTGDRYNQNRLLVHPLVESFLYLKWKALLPFFYTILACYAFFVMSLTIFVISVFFYKDTKEATPMWLDPTIWGYIVYTSIFLIFLQELLYMNIKSSRYFLQLETWVKFGSIVLGSILPPAIAIASWSSADWPRHVATIALLLSWIELMFLLSRFPNWGYYVLMFGKVASNVIKILSTFAFLVIGFSLSFMIQFRSQMPFDGPWAALVKTMVMMTSEFDYGALFDEQHTRDLSTSILILRLIFVVFLILAAIVLMNLMVGVAVNDINDLEILGNIRRLAKQVEFLGTLDTLVYNRVIGKILPRRMNLNVRKKSNVSNVIVIYPGRPRWRHTKIIPAHLRDAIFNKATAQKKQLDHETGMQEFIAKIDKIYDKIVKRDDCPKIIDYPDWDERPMMHKKKNEDILNHLTHLDGDISEMKGQISEIAEQSQIKEVHVKIDQMAIEMEGIKQFLMRLESKLGKL